MKKVEINYLTNPTKEEGLIYFDTTSENNVAHVNIGSEEKPYYLPQEMFKITDGAREILIQNLKKEIK